VATIKCTMLCQSVSNTGEIGGVSRVGGWSESWYSNAGIEQTRTSFLTLCQKRAGCFPQGTSVIGQRYQQVVPNVTASQVTSNRFPGGATWDSDVPQMALLVKIPAKGTIANIRQWCMRGIPDTWVKKGELSAVPGQAAALAAFWAELDNWRFRGVALDAEQADIDFIDENGVANLLGPVTTAANTLVKIKSTKDENKRSVSGIFKVGAGPTSQVVPLVNWNAGFCTKGKLQLYEIIFPNLDGPSISVGRVIQRKVGRPFNSYRGRRSKRR